LRSRCWRNSAITSSQLTARTRNRYLDVARCGEILARKDVLMGTRALEKALWAGALDAVGGETLAWLTRTMQAGRCDRQFRQRRRHRTAHHPVMRSSCAGSASSALMYRHSQCRCAANLATFGERPFGRAHNQRPGWYLLVSLVDWLVVSSGQVCGRNCWSKWHMRCVQCIAGMRFPGCCRANEDGQWSVFSDCACSGLSYAYNLPHISHH